MNYEVKILESESKNFSAIELNACEGKSEKNKS